MIHTREDALMLLQLLRETISPNAELIGSFGKGVQSSEHDIDIYIHDKEKSFLLKQELINLLNPSKVEDTDWDGWYFHDTSYGDVDIFFSIKDFDF